MERASLQNLNSEEVSRLLSIIEKLSGSLDRDTIRQEIAEDLLRLLHSDFIASFIWNEDLKKFSNAIFLNMGPENIAQYNTYYQFCDPITSHLQKRRQATLVCEVMPQKELEKTEFFNDFLMADGLHHGINIYAYDRDVNIGDLRIWRTKNRPNFGFSEKRILDTLLPYFRNALRNARALSETQENVGTWNDFLKTTKTALFLFDENGHLNYLNSPAKDLEGTLRKEIYKTLFERITSLARGDHSQTLWGPFSLSVLSTRSKNCEKPVKAVLVQGTNPSKLSQDYLIQKYALSPREAEISLLVCKGLTDKEIASALGISFSTVRTHLKRIYRKVDITTRSELIFVLIEDHVTISP